MPFWTYLYALLFWPLLVATVFTALHWGGPAERQTSLIYAAACCLEVLLWSRASTRFSNVELGVAAVDIGLLITLATLTVRYGIAWLYLVTAIQMVMALSHFIKLIDPGLENALQIGSDATFSLGPACADERHLRWILTGTPSPAWLSDVLLKEFDGFAAIFSANSARHLRITGDHRATEQLAAFRGASLHFARCSIRGRT